MKAWILACVFVVAAMTAKAELPHLKTGEYRGCFALHETSRYDFELKYNGEMALVPKKRDKERVAIANRIKIEYGIEEVMPDGSVVFKKTSRQSLTTKDDASDRFTKMTFLGTTTGEAVYEVVIEQSRDIISIGGRVVMNGSLTQNPLRFVVRVTVPNSYRTVRIDDRDDEREFEKKTRRDYLEVVRSDHSKVQLSNDDRDEVNGAELTGSGIEEVEMRLSYYEGRRFHFNADKQSGMTLTPGHGSGAWFEGFTLHWTRDAAKDPEGKAQLNMYIK